MFFPWHEYEELPAKRRNTLQIFITNRCNLNCDGCFARFAMKEDNSDITLQEYRNAIADFLDKDGEQVNLLGGEPLLHPNLKEILDINKGYNLKTTIYTNGYFLDSFNKKDFERVKIRVSLYCKTGMIKSLDKLPRTDIPIEVCYMVSKNTTVAELVESATCLEKSYNCNVFFISSIRELNNQRQEFFDDTGLTMNLLEYKEIVHKFLQSYKGDMEIHISKRGVFESTKTLAEHKCRFANYFIGRKIIQCPYDAVNLKFQKDYQFNSRNCQQNNTCLMSKIILKRNPLFPAKKQGL
jgi:organic radical activating enzyme